MAHVVVVFGTRPEAIKLAPVVAGLRRRRPPDALHAGHGGVKPRPVVTIATGQHDALLSTALASFSLTPDIELRVMRDGQDLTTTGAVLLDRLGCVLRHLRPAVVVVQGDTLTAAMAAMAAFMNAIPVAHVEAGLRTHLPVDPFPEEAQRTAITALAALHLTPTQRAANVLVESGVCAAKVRVVGNPVIDALMAVLQRPPPSTATHLLASLSIPLPSPLPPLSAGAGHPAAVTSPLATVDGGVGGGGRGAAVRVLLVTMHRRENMGPVMQGMIAAVRSLVAAHSSLRVVLPVHPNPNVHAAVVAGLTGVASVRVIQPQPYEAFAWLLAAVDGVLTDSGGLQEEAVALGKRLFIMRTSTERPEVLAWSGCTLLGTSSTDIVAAVSAWLAPSPAGHAVAVADRGGQGGHPADLAAVQRPSWRGMFGDGRAGDRIASAVWEFATVAADPAALAAWHACTPAGEGHGAVAAPSPPPPVPYITDHTSHSYHWHEGIESLLPGHRRFHHDIECSAQPATDRVRHVYFKDLMAMPSTYQR